MARWRTRRATTNVIDIAPSILEPAGLTQAKVFDAVPPLRKQQLGKGVEANQQHQNRKVQA
jgi:arylsulfatase A-like enzyme